MSVAIHGGQSGAQADIESASRAIRTILVGRGNPFCVSNITGTIAAALAANSSVFAMRLDPSASVRAYIERVRLHYTCLVAFTTPLTAGRRLALFRGSGAAPSGGTAIATATRKHTAYGATSEFDTANGGAIAIASTGALTTTGITFESDALRTMQLVHVGNAGNFQETIFEFAAGESFPIVLEPGQVLAVRNPSAMDAAGTWQLAVNIDWHEEVTF